LNNDHSYKPCDIETWAEQYKSLSRSNLRHVSDQTIGNYRISTVWLGIDHNFYNELYPLLFETMVFPKDSYADIYMQRYSTWNEAVESHKKTVEWVKNGCPEND
jgi:hypothetical protein